MIEQLQRTEKWFADRLGYATSSNFNKVLAQGRGGQEATTRRKYRAELVRQRLTGVYESRYKGEEMDWGADTEDLAKLTYERFTGRTIDDCEFIKHSKLKAGASPDGLVGKDGLVEIKCPDTSTHQETIKLGAVPTEYIKQIQGQLWITGRKWCDFISFDPEMPGQSQLFVKRVWRDEKLIGLIEFQVTKFLKEVDADEKYFKNYKVKA